MSSEIGIQEILELLPHRYPFLLVDRIETFVPRKQIVGRKCVTMNEPFFQGHFPEKPVMPGVLLIEALAQAAGVLIMREIEDRQSKLVLFTGIDQCRFRRPVIPGDVVKLEVDVINLRPRAAKMNARATVDGQLAAEAVLLSALADREAVK